MDDIEEAVIGLRRYIAPQGEAMARVLTQPAEWLLPGDRRLLREVVQDEPSDRVSEQIDRNMYVMSLVAAIFLPLGLITGYLGINVGGIPGAEWQGAFRAVGLLLLALAAVEIWIFKRLKWI